MSLIILYYIPGRWDQRITNTSVLPTLFDMVAEGNGDRQHCVRGPKRIVVAIPTTCDPQ